MLKNSQWEQINNLIVSIYGIDNVNAMCKAVISKLMQIIGFDLGEFNLSDEKKGRNHWLDQDPVVVSIFDKDREREFTSLYVNKYYKIDYVNWIFAHHESVVYRESDLINTKVRKESKFYKEYLARYDLGNVAGVSVISAGKLRGALTLYKSESKENFSKNDLYVLELLKPHFQKRLMSPVENKSNNQRIFDNILKYTFQITNKERQIIDQIFEGLKNKEIAETNNIALNTVKSHISNIYDKTNTNSRTKLINFLIENGYIC